MASIAVLPAPPAQAARFVGIARLAGESPRVAERAEVEFFALPCRSALNRESSGRMPFAWTLNPYRGCEFGCKYCSARYTHEFMPFLEEEFPRLVKRHRKLCAHSAYLNGK